MPSEKKFEAKTKKLAVLQIILEEKHILFAPFSSKITSQEKVRGWEKVLTKAKSVGLVADKRDWKFVRDKLYGVWKSRTMSKRDNTKATGSEGGKDKILDEVDLKILEIIDNKPAVLDGLGMPETGEGSSGDEDPKEEEPKEDANESAQPQKKRNTVKRKLCSDIAPQTNNNKEDLTLQLLEVEVYHRKLQCLKLERDLGLSPSQITSKLFQKPIEEDEAPIYLTPEIGNLFEDIPQPQPAISLTEDDLLLSNTNTNNKGFIMKCDEEGNVFFEETK